MGKRFKVGDLVKFVGYTYSPDYYYAPELSIDRSLGIVMQTVSTSYAGIETLETLWLYRVYWFKTDTITETIASHLSMAESKK
jgi:hypothetical protein